MKLTASHPAGLESLRDIEDKLSLKIAHAHNHHGTLSVNFTAPPGKYEMDNVEHLWPDGPVNMYLNGDPLDLEADGPNPFANNRAHVNGHIPSKLVRRI
jgi:hypothetical protein